MQRRFRVVSGVFVILLFILSYYGIFYVYALNDMSIYVNNKKLVTNVPVKIIDGRSLVPLRIIFEALGINVKWDDATKIITGTKGNNIITLQIDNNKAKVNDKEVTISVPPIIINGTTMVPVRFIAESSGSDVRWDEKSNSIYLTIDGNASYLTAPFEENGIKYVSKVEGKDFLIYSGGKWQKKFLKGVDIGAGKPGAFPGELAVTKAEYLRWFKYISDMNADVVRVYTTLKPDFYDALYEFNKSSDKPLYLMQGVWVCENAIGKNNDAYANNEEIKNKFIKDAEDLVDIFHGNADLPNTCGFASGKYKNDISKYVIGWILGIEWDPNFVDETNKNNPSKTAYSGKYLHTENAPPFETFLCEVGDKVIEYEVTKYHMFRALSYAGWPPTDMLKHPNEPLKNEDMSEVNVEYIKPMADFKSGVFASYHIYPYYPDFMNYQTEYAQFKDDDGSINTYKAYLKDLLSHHTVPVLVAEFGVPASRGKAHNALYSGYNQGNHDEKEQGKIIKHLLKDIYDVGCMGGLVFAWQDEWFKRTWNTMDFDLPDTRSYWSNTQTNEQFFGLLAFDPGEEKCVCYVDGDIDDWKNDKLLYETRDGELYVKSDEKYVYLMVKLKNYNFDKDSLYIPVDSIDDQGNETDIIRNINFSRPADLLIQINGENNSKVLVDAYYDSFYYMYAEQLGMIDIRPEYREKGEGIFTSMYLCLCRELFLPSDKRTIPFSKYETGVLKFGDANPGHNNYNSLADFCYKDGNVEIKIPWGLLNVMDPSSKTVIGNLYKNKGIKGQIVDGFYFGLGIMKDGNISDSEIGMEFYSWDKWSVPTFHERLKPSYYIVKDAFKDIK